MSRRKIPGDQKLQAFAYYKRGVRVGAAITRLLETDYVDAVTERTVRRWLPDFKEVLERTAGIDEPFEWNRMAEYGIPWDQGRFIFSIALEAQSWSRLLPGYPALTGREAVWCWRVRGALRGFNVIKTDIYSVAMALAARELRHEVLGEALYTADIEAWMQYRPWELPQGFPSGSLVLLTPRTFDKFPQTGAYLAAIDQGIIPELRIHYADADLEPTAKAFQERGRDWVAAAVSAFWPSDRNGPRWLLPSQKTEAALDEKEREEGEDDEQAREQ